MQQMLNLLPLIAMFAGFFFFLIYLPLRAKRKKALAQLEKHNIDLIELRKKILVVSSSTIAGKEIKDVLGHVTGTSKIEASTPEQADAAEKEAMANIMRNALEMGANAIIDVKLSSSSHEQQGSKWMVSKSCYTGTAVVIG